MISAWYYPRETAWSTPVSAPLRLPRAWNTQMSPFMQQVDLETTVVYLPYGKETTQ